MHLPGDAQTLTCACCALSFATLQVVAELRMRLNLDPDGSDTFDRVMGHLGSWDRLGVSAPGTPFGAEAAEVRAEARSFVDRSAPLLSRMAHKDPGPITA